jgi:hypothetical protein
VITYVKSQEAKLFDAAATELGIARANLTIDEYLSRLSELYAISPRFVRLPLYEDGHEDEEIFEIDANARTIAVPRSFATNGVGVVSDELAETLWFRINRYFDIKDFGLAEGTNASQNIKDGSLHILIEWEAPDGQKGASWAYAVDVDTDPDWVYFGWALTAEHLTSKAGQIKFAVRIIQYNPDGIAYSFATQVANVTVKSTLEFDLAAQDFLLESVADKISNRIMGGHIAFCPVFIDTPETVDGQEVVISGDLPEYIDTLTAPVGGGDASAELKVKAGAPDNEEYDAMAYIWYKKGKDDTEFNEVTELADGAYTPALTVTSSGQYYVVIYGMKEIVDNTIHTYDAENEQASADPEKFWYHTSVASTKSTVCEIPSPIPLEIKLVPANTLIIPGEDNTETVVIELTGRQMIGSNVKVGIPGFRVEATNNAALITEGEPNFTEVTLQESQVSWAEDDNGCTITFNTWTTETETIAVPDGDSGDMTEEVRVIKTNIPQAYYRFTVLNTLNGDTAETEEQFICRITEAAIEPRDLLLKVYNFDETLYTGEELPSAARRQKIRITYTDLEASESDGISYEWYRVVGDINDEYTDEPLDEEGDELEPNRGGSYYAIVTNRFNGTERRTMTNVISFND